jgi:uncharacterized protein YndB with AHSA1/START domain
MKVVRFVGWGLLALVVLTWGVGALLSRTHVASRAARFAQPPEAVWQVVSDLSGFGKWAPRVTGVTRLADQNGHPVWALLGESELPLEVEELRPPYRMVTRIANPRLPFGGTWTWEIADAGSGCTVTITERGEIKSAFFRALARFVFGYTSNLDAYLEALGKHFGEDVTPVAAAEA